MKFFARLCRDHARAIVLICVLMTIPVAVGVSFLEVRAGQKDLIPTRMETARTLNQVDQLFGGTTNEYPMVESDELLTYPMIKKFLLFETAMAETLGTDDYVYIQHFLTAFAGNALAEAQKQYGPMARDISTILRLAEGTMVPNPENPAEKIPSSRSSKTASGNTSPTRWPTSGRWARRGRPCSPRMASSRRY